MYLTNHAAHTVKFQIRGAKTYLIAQDFNPPLAQLLSNGVNSFCIRDMTSLKVVDGPFAVVPRAHGVVWLYNGARNRKAVLKVFPEENVMVYVTWARLPAALRIEGVPLPNAHP